MDARGPGTASFVPDTSTLLYQRTFDAFSNIFIHITTPLRTHPGTKRG